MLGGGLHRRALLGAQGGVASCVLLPPIPCKVCALRATVPLPTPLPAPVQHRPQHGGAAGAEQRQVQQAAQGSRVVRSSTAADVRVSAGKMREGVGGRVGQGHQGLHQQRGHSREAPHHSLPREEGTSFPTPQGILAHRHACTLGGGHVLVAALPPPQVGHKLLNVLIAIAAARQAADLSCHAGHTSRHQEHATVSQERVMLPELQVQGAWGAVRAGEVTGHSDVNLRWEGQQKGGALDLTVFKQGIM
eukprot:1159215-Pelagomonas_calceolata.AAC.16